MAVQAIVTLGPGTARTPLISVIIPSFNCAPHLGRAIDSVLAQSLRELEIIVVDDGSTDGTQEAVEPYLKYRNIRYLRQTNRGPSAARNAGLKASESKYVMFVDADDALPPDALATMEAAVSLSGASWCVTDIYRVCGQSRIIVKSEVPAADLLHEILAVDFVRRGVFFRRVDLLSVGGYDEELTIREDWDLNIRMIERGKCFEYVPEPLYLYSWRPESLTTGDPSRVLRCTNSVLTKHHKRLADLGDREAAKIYAANLWDLGRRYFHQIGNVRQAAACVRQSLAYDLNAGRFFHSLFHQLRHSRQSA